MIKKRSNSCHPGTDLVPTPKNPVGHPLVLGPVKGISTESARVKVSAGRPETAGRAMCQLVIAPVVVLMFNVPEKLTLP